MLSLTLADPEDYLETIRLLTFRTGLRRVCTSLPIINDALLEDDESFYIMLTTADPLVLLSPRQGSVVIRSDDRKNGFIRESVEMAQTPLMPHCIIFLSLQTLQQRFCI